MCEQKSVLRVAHVFGTLNLGGAETMIMNVFRALGNRPVTFHFFVSGQEQGYYEPEVRSLGGRIHHLTKRSESIWNHHAELYRILKEQRYDIVHFHTQNAFTTLLEILMVKLAGKARIVVHCHNTMDWRGKKMLLLHKASRGLMNALTDVKLSCGAAAAQWLYGTEKNVTVIPLPVICDRYLYSPERNHALRTDAGLLGKRVYLHVGRFSDVKNHSFLLDIFAELIKRQENSVLLMAGDGELRGQMEAKAEQLGISGNVSFLGNISDVYDKMCLADGMIFPSKYEGFPTVILEAQAAGLPCLISDTITPAIAVTDLVERYPLDATAAQWAEKMLEKSADAATRLAANGKIRALYDVTVTVEQLMRAYTP